MKAVPRSLPEVFARHRIAIGLTVALLLLTLLAGAGLLSLAAHFLTATALAGALAGSFNFFGPSAGIRALTLARILSRYGEKLIGHDATLRIARDLRRWFFARMLPLAPLELGRERAGDLLTRLMADIDSADGLLVRALGPLLALLLLALALVAGVALALPTAAAWLAVALAAQAVAALLSTGRAGDAERQHARDRAALRQNLQETLEGTADLIALEAVAQRLAGVDADADALAASSRRLQRRLALAGLVHGLLSALALPWLLYLLLQGFAAGQLSAPAAAAALFACLVGLELGAGLGLAWQSLRGARAAIERLQALARREPAVRDPATPVPLPPNGTLVLQGLRFGWEGGRARPLLADLALSLQPGERVLISGDSGAGKSSLLALLLRLRDPDAGRICFGGVDLRQAALADWQARIAWLPQDAPVFAGSVRENLELGDAEADDARLWQALAQVRMDAAVRALPDGLDSWLGEGGASLSAGQARRIALARALLRDAPLLLLDEPTEGLDTDTADALLRDLAQACGGRSLIVISHGEVPDTLVQRRYRLRDGRLALL